MMLPDPLPWFLAIYVVVNFSVLLMFGYDKRQAVFCGRRLSERTLLFSAFIAPFGALFGMLIFRHKIRNLKFFILVPGFIAFHGIFIFLILLRA